MGLVSKTYTFTAGTTIVASEHNTNYDTLYNCVNGNIDNANIGASAAIADTKLAQLTTAGKVSGAALTSLSSVPSGAGAMPAANITNWALTSEAQGDIAYRNASAWVRLAAGTSGQYLKTQGAAANPAWSGSALGTWASKTIDTEYTATTDGFVVATMQIDNGDDVTFNTPTATLRQRLYTGSGTTAFNGSICCPVKNGDTYKLILVSGTVTPQAYYFIPLFG